MCSFMVTILSSSEFQLWQQVYLRRRISPEATNFSWDINLTSFPGLQLQLYNVVEGLVKQLHRMTSGRRTELWLSRCACMLIPSPSPAGNDIVLCPKPSPHVQERVWCSEWVFLSKWAGYIAPQSESSNQISERVMVQWHSNRAWDLALQTEGKQPAASLLSPQHVQYNQLHLLSLPDVGWKLMVPSLTARSSVQLAVDVYMLLLVE